MLWLLSWKNIWRNKLRSIVVITAVTLGVFAGIFMIAFMNGMVEDRIKSVIRTEISHIQIHQPDFKENHDFSLRINNADSLIQKIIQTKYVAAVCKRIIISSLVASAETNTGVIITGIVPDEEKKVTNISDKIIVGKYFEGRGKNAVVIGKKFVEKLKVTINKKIIITLQDINKNITSGAFRVVGIYETDNTMYDEANVFVRYNDLCILTGLNDTETHEIAVLLTKNESSETVKQELKKNFPELEVQDWMELSPEAGYLVSAMDQYMIIFILIILLALCFGIINTMLMVVLERVKELGMLMAVGMSKPRVFFMIMLETVYLSLTGGLIGIVSGYIICKHLEKAGLNLYFWKEVYSSVGYSSFIYPTIDFQMIVFTTWMVILTGILSALYPAYKALKLNPAEATRTE
ncbi:MAG: ABC transporter permease [Bacteroidia bacterium]|nr:ABC transporter permease [Bacteroidia bacterium]